MMRNIFATLSVVLFSVLLLFLSGCSAEQEIILNENGSGRGSLDIRLDPVFVAYLSDIGMGFGATADAPLFDVAAVEEAFAGRPGVALDSISVSERDRLILEISFDSVEHVLAMEGQSLARFLRFERTEGFRRLAAEIDRRAIEHFTDLSGMDPVVVESLMPPDPQMSRREYQDHLAWALEEYAGDRPLELVFRESRIITNLVPSGQVVRLDGGARNGDGVRFDTSLVEAVTTPAPLRYSVVFVP
jgi:hypothetical protein